MPVMNARKNVLNITVFCQGADPLMHSIEDLQATMPSGKTADMAQLRIYIRQTLANMPQVIRPPPSKKSNAKPVMFV